MAETDRDQLQAFHIALESSLEQLGYAQQIAARGSLEAPPEELQALERVAGELIGLRNRVRERLMKVLAKPALNIIK